MASPNPFQGKVIAITGAASGIGLATAKYPAARGASLSLADIQSEALEAAATSIETATSTPILATVVDIRNSDSVNQWISATVKRFGKLSGAVNLAAIVGKSMGKTDVCDFDESEWDLIMDVNLKGTFRCLKAELSVIEDGGSIVNTSSIAGVRGLPKFVSPPLNQPVSSWP
jgi:NAD(P)-dependent dehydrogenase (short-subunit alcohol dehydrogenase family)